MEVNLAADLRVRFHGSIIEFVQAVVICTALFNGYLGNAKSNGGRSEISVNRRKSRA